MESIEWFSEGFRGGVRIPCVRLHGVSQGSIGRVPKGMRGFCKCVDGVFRGGQEERSEGSKVVLSEGFRGGSGGPFEGLSRDESGVLRGSEKMDLRRDPRELQTSVWGFRGVREGLRNSNPRVGSEGEHEGVRWGSEGMFR